MLNLAKHIIQTKVGEFVPAGFDDRYEAPLAELIKAKLAGKPIKVAKKAAPAKPIDLMAALRASVSSGSPPPKPRAPKKAA